MIARLCLVSLLVATVPAASDPLSVSGRWLIDTYKAVLSPLQGRDVCNFWPTCSQFTRQAIDQHGILLGSIIGADRLTRCHPQAWSYHADHYLGIEHERLADPVANRVAWLPVPEPDAGRPATCTQAPAGDHTRKVSSVCCPAFAEHLFSRGDYPRAAAEYRRALWTETVAVEYGTAMAAESYLAAGNLARAAELFAHRALPPDLRAYGLARVSFAAGDYVASHDHLAKVDEPELMPAAGLFGGWVLLRLGRYAEAADALSSVPEMAGIPIVSPDRRSRTGASLLSAMLPGAGQAYAGRLADGVYSLLTVGAVGFLTGWYATHPEHDRHRIKVGLSGALLALFYAANIYGANVAARDFNQLGRRRLLERAEAVLSVQDLRPDYRRLLESNPESLPVPANE